MSKQPPPPDYHAASLVPVGACAERYDAMRGCGGQAGDNGEGFGVRTLSSSALVFPSIA